MRRRIGDRLVVQVTARTLIVAAIAILAGSYLIAGAFSLATGRHKDDAFHPNFDPGGVVVVPSQPDARPPVYAAPAPEIDEPQAPPEAVEDDGLRSL